MHSPNLNRIASLTLVTLLTACSLRLPTPAPNSTQVQVEPSAMPSIVPTLAASTTVPTVATIIPSSPTPALATATIAQPSPAPAQPSATPVLPSPTSANLTIKVYLIAIGDKGVSGKTVGCGDSVVAVQKSIPHAPAVLKGAFDALCSIKDQYYGQSGLYNALYQSNLHLERAVLEDGKATIHLAGTLKMGGECDTPRVEAQIRETALQFATVKEADIYLNGQPLKEALSLK
jgi:hypothetical protein